MTERDWLATDALRPNDRTVSSEEIDGEAIVMNHDSGVYFNSTGSGALIWRAISQGASRDQIVDALAAHYALEADAVRSDVTAFIADLERHGLIVSGGAAPPEVTSLSGSATGSYQPPEIGVHTDLADLLLLDPIHEVAEAGWPSPHPVTDDERT